MSMVLREPRNMGRPKKPVDTVSIRIDADAQQLARQACSYSGESIVDYISRIVREQAGKDAREGAERFLRESKKAEGKGGRN